MATKAAKTTNPERMNRKAWGKGHNAPVKELSAEAQERKARKLKERAERRAASSGPRQSSYTMPKINWEWLAETMRGRLLNSRRVKHSDYVLSQQKRGHLHDEVPVVIEQNPEAKPKKKGK